MLKILRLRRLTLKSLEEAVSLSSLWSCRSYSTKLLKCLATQQSNGMLASGSQNQLQSSLVPLSDLLKALTFLSNLNGFNSSPSPPVQGFNQRKGSSKVWKKNDSKWFYHLLLYSCFCLLHYLCVLLLFWVSLVLCFVLFNMFLFVYFQFFVYFVFDIKINK